MAGANPDRVRALVGPAVAELGLELEQVTVTSAGRRRLLRLVVDGDGGVSLDAVAEATRRASEVLDASDLMGEQPYVLEVSSPGVDRPLTEPKHWRRASGRLVKVTLADGSVITGRVMAVEHDGVLVDLTGKGAGRDRRVAFGDITRAQVEVEFSRGAVDSADASDDPGDGADEPDEEA